MCVTICLTCEKTHDNIKDKFASKPPCAIHIVSHVTPPAGLTIGVPQPLGLSFGEPDFSRNNKLGASKST